MLAVLRRSPFNGACRTWGASPMGQVMKVGLLPLARRFGTTPWVVRLGEGGGPAIVTHREQGEGESTTTTYPELRQQSSDLAANILRVLGSRDLQGARVGFLCPPSADYVLVTWAIWRAGGMCVPLCTSHPEAELRYYVDDADVCLVLAHDQFHAVGESLAEYRRVPYRRLETVLSEAPPLLRDGPPLLRDGSPLCTEGGEGVRIGEAAGGAPVLPAVSEGFMLPAVSEGQKALIIYTSGTTGKPKGVVYTHKSLAAQVLSMQAPWRWSSRDRLLHCLPLHHVHGVVNCVVTPLACGATIEFLPKFTAAAVWARLLEGGQGAGTPITVFMAVPTIYTRLIAHYTAATEPEQVAMRSAAASLRLFVSGSAALPEVVMAQWIAISGHTLLERYGMTEIGMCLSNPYEQGARVPGHVGLPLPGVEVSVDPETAELLVRGETVFQEYWGRPEQTKKEFNAEGWFTTGDAVVLNEVEVTRPDGSLETVQSYKINGRMSVDILKSGGYKISALDVEATLLEHPLVAEVAVVGVADLEYGQKVAAIIALHDPEATLELVELRAWAKERMASYKCPSVLRVLPSIPRNAMGKVNKKALILDLFT